MWLLLYVNVFSSFVYMLIVLVWMRSFQMEGGRVLYVSVLLVCSRVLSFVIVSLSVPRTLHYLAQWTSLISPRGGLAR